jgi:DNA-binding XRE family transcriptional regulator
MILEKSLAESIVNNIPISGDLIKSYRVSSGITQKEFSNILGVSKASVCKWDSGLTPGYWNQMKIKRFLSEKYGLYFDEMEQHMRYMDESNNRDGGKGSSAIKKEKHGNDDTPGNARR